MATTARKRNVDVSSALDELFPTRQGPKVDTDAVWIERGLIEANPLQPRKTFSSDTLRELGQSLQTNGQLQACVVRPHPDLPGHFQIISGERRWRAAGPEFADLPRLRCVIREADDAEAFRLALAENIHREDLSVVERARALVQIKESEPGFTWEKVAEQAQLSKRRILHLVELLKLPEEVVAHLDSGDINEKHARALLGLQKQPGEQHQLMEEILRGDLSGNAALARVESRSARKRENAGARPVTGNETSDGSTGAAMPKEAAMPRGGAYTEKADILAKAVDGTATNSRMQYHKPLSGRAGLGALLQPVVDAVEQATRHLEDRQLESTERDAFGASVFYDGEDPVVQAEVRDLLRQVREKLKVLETTLLPKR